MDHNFGVREGKALALLTGREENRAHGSREADADGRDVRLDVVHRVENGEAGRDVAARGVDIERDVFFRVFRGEEEHLRDNEIRDVAIDRPAEENDALFEKAAIDIIRPLAHRRLFDNHRNQHLRFRHAGMVPKAGKPGNGRLAIEIYSRDMEGEKPVQLPRELLRRHEKYGEGSRLKQVGSSGEHVTRWADLRLGRTLLSGKFRPETAKDFSETIKKEFAKLSKFGVISPIANVIPMKRDSELQGGPDVESVFIVAKDVVHEKLEQLDTVERKRYAIAFRKVAQGLLDYYREKSVSNEPFLFDILQDYQYAWGKTNSDAESKLYLVDVDPYFDEEPKKLLECMERLASYIELESATTFKGYPEFGLSDLKDEVRAACEQYKVKKQL